MKSSEMWKFIWISTWVILSCVGNEVLGRQRPASENGTPPPSRPAVADSVRKANKIKYSYKPTGIRFGANVFRLASSALSSNKTNWDITGDIDFHKYMLEVSYGRASNMVQNDSLNYSNAGSFFRIGGDINFIKDKTDANALVIGLKYVRGTYDETLSFTDIDDLFGNSTRNLSNNGLTSSWMEANVGMKVRMWEQLYLGFYFRYRFSLVVKGNREFGTYQIPGYGLEERRNIVGLDYYIFWRIPFKKSPKIENTF
ncbi:MAG: DUF6048 family protein [Bacteroidota bacterium]